jgi:hypothetical protein
MDDEEMDTYLGRCIKNWTARHAPSSEGRELLLLKAASSVQGAKENRSSNSSADYPWTPSQYRPFRPPQDLSPFGAYAPAKFWPIHLLTTMRLIT